MKALILAGGRGKRIDPLTDGGNKCLIEINGKRLIEHNLDMFVNIPEISEIVMVVGHRAEDLINRFGIEYKGKKIKYVIQPEQRGVVNAMEVAREALEGQDFVLGMGDQVITGPKIHEMIKDFNEKKLFSSCGVIKEEDHSKIGRTYSLMCDPEWKIHRLVEKPKNPTGNLQGTGFCVFSFDLFNYLDRTPTNPIRGEKEMVDLIQAAIDDNKHVRAFFVADKYTNINTETDLLYARSIMKEAFS
ncbi:MAG: nucleotidyltransferase family protein [archaeon]|nr:MAG: nucleotidyltransferase family protein [archaeon]